MKFLPGIAEVSTYFDSITNFQAIISGGSALGLIFAWKVALIESTAVFKVPFLHKLINMYPTAHVNGLPSAGKFRL